MVRSDLLVAEAQGEDADEHFVRIVGAPLDGVDRSVSLGTAPPSRESIHKLVERHRSSPHKLVRIAEALGEKRTPLDRYVVDRFIELLFADSDDVRLDAVWVVVGTNALPVLGAALEQRNWSWSAHKPYLESAIGSDAVAAANRDTPFRRIAHRLAPARLLPALSERECTSEDVAIAVELINVVLESSVAPPGSPLEISHDLTAAEEMVDYLHSFGDIREPGDGTSFAENLLKTGDEYHERRSALAKTYFDKVVAARRAGAHLHLELIHARHFDVVFRQCPDGVDGWLCGLEEATPAIVQRVQLADGFYVSLCEALLVNDPSRGVGVWRTLKECLTHVRFTVHGDMDRLLHALFAAGDDPEVGKALDEVYAIDAARNDIDLIDLIVAARKFGREEWLRSKVAQDEQSPSPLHRRRAAFLAPLLAIPPIADATAWPAGWQSRGVASASWKLGQREAFARHWLSAFASAETPEAAHAAWRLFLVCVDRRAWAWMADVLDWENSSSPLAAVQRRFVGKQKQKLLRAMADNAKHWKENYTHRRYPRALWPWNQ